MTIAFVPLLANWNMIVTVMLLCSGILYYVVNEASRIAGHRNGLISRMTILASRPVEQGFVWGPVTLGLGALAALLYYPNPAATVAIYALAFGDGLASLVGRFWGGRRIFINGEKTLVGSIACLAAVFVSSWLVLEDPLLALATAVVATILELVPLRDLDNLIIPLGTGLFVTLFL
jgi:dolichol kinase